MYSTVNNPQMSRKEKIDQSNIVVKHYRDSSHIIKRKIAFMDGDNSCLTTELSVKEDYDNVSNEFRL
jgi:hypothetical protein